MTTEPTPQMEIVPALHDAVERRSDAIVAVLRDLVRLPSETHPPGGDELEAQRYVERLFTSLGLAVDVFEPTDVPGIADHPGWWPGYDYRDRPNVVGRWGPSSGQAGLILNGHIDVVPAGDRDLWSVPPYAAEVVDDQVIGRGTVDMKAGIAAMTMAVACLQEVGFEPARAVVLESVVNEELGGFNGTLACCLRGYEAGAAVVTEPTAGRIVVAAKGGQAYRVTVPGNAVHHGQWWRGVSALDKALVIKDALRGWEAIRAAEAAGTPDLASDGPVPALADTVWFLQAGREDVMATPAEAVLEFWVDLLPDDARDAVLDRFEAHLFDAAAEDTFLRENPPTIDQLRMRPFAGTRVPRDHPIVASLARAHSQVIGATPALALGNAANDSMIFNLYSSTPAIVYGPGSILSAHSPNERIAIRDLLQATEVLALTIADFCGPG